MAAATSMLSALFYNTDNSKIYFSLQNLTNILELPTARDVTTAKKCERFQQFTV